ncbi:hypothetical protein TR2A62_0543 [Thalassobium sp. R2A62]|nr:hypothetical protein TR2A62_0543 [Thalassobium sp. R2A62]
MIDLSIYIAMACVPLGVLCEISMHLSNSQSTNADSSTSG